MGFSMAFDTAMTGSISEAYANVYTLWENMLKNGPSMVRYMFCKAKATVRE